MISSMPELIFGASSLIVAVRFEVDGQTVNAIQPPFSAA
jgi:hypothetical protein